MLSENNKHTQKDYGSCNLKYPVYVPDPEAHPELSRKVLVRQWSHSES